MDERPAEAVFARSAASGLERVWTKFEINGEKLFRTFPGCQFFFEAADIVTQIMNFGAPTPMEST